jgi:pimeloyl-ACP methyl ester carboxylesterase
MQAQLNGITLHYTDQGQGTPVLLAHAFPLAGRMWQHQIDALAGDYRLIVPDLRGFGASDAPAGPYRMEQYADDLAALLDALSLPQVVLGGLSMGGYIAFAFLRRHAARLRGLVLADTRATPDSDQAREGRETNAQLAENEGAAAIADKMLPNLLAPAASDEVKATVRGIIESNPPQGIAGALRGMGLRPDSSDLLASIQVPTLLLVGDQDGLTSPEEMRGMQSAIPNSRLVEIPGAGHLAALENPAAFNSALREFLQQL